MFLDESGDLNFSRSGSKYYVITALSLTRPFPPLIPLMELKHDLWESDVELEYFHAAEDSQIVRDQVFNILTASLGSFRVDAVVVEKPKTHPTLQKDHGRFYQKMFEILLKYVLQGQSKAFDKMIICSDVIPVHQKRRSIEKGIKQNLSLWAKQDGNSYAIQYCASKSELNLQVVDYLCWAISRKHERNDLRSYNLIRNCIRSEFDVFQLGTTLFY
jgi:hypothetical protein